MKSLSLILTLLEASSFALAATLQKCNADNCARAVTGTYQTLQSAHLQDCSSFFMATVFPPTVTQTVTKTVTPTTVPYTRTTGTNTLSTTIFSLTTISQTVSTVTIQTTYSTTSVAIATDTVFILTGTVTVNQNARRTVSSPSQNTATSTSNAIAATILTLLQTQTQTSSITVTQVQSDVDSILYSSTVTIPYAATTTAVAVGNAYCENGQTVNGLSGSCTTQPCVVFNLRIEGNTGTIYEGPINTGPMDITTASGDTHLCNGQNGGANAVAAGTGTTCLASAGGLCGFDFDGTYSSSFDDYFIERIGDTDQTSNEFWGILLNFAFTPAGGCQTEPPANSELLWAFNAFNANYFLDVQPRTATVAAGGVIVFTVTGYDGNGGGPTPVSRASFNGLTSNANGQVVGVFPTPGTYRLKATRSDSIRSPGVIVTVT